MKNSKPVKQEKTFHYIIRVGGLLLLSSSVISLSLAINNLFLTFRDQVIHANSVIVADIMYIVVLLAAIIMGTYLYSKYVSKISVEQLINL